MFLPATLQDYASRLRELYLTLAGCQFVPTKITQNTWIGNTPTPDEERYARGLLRELYSLMSPGKKPVNREGYERTVQRVGELTAATAFYFPLPQTVRGTSNPWETADKITRELKTRMGKDS